MKSAIEIALLCTVIVLLGSGCSAVQKVGDWVYDAEVSTTVIDGVPTSTTNWVVSPKVRTGITVGGTLSPQPTGTLLSQAVLAALGVFGALRARKWKRAATDGVDAAQQFREVLERSPSKGKLTDLLAGLKRQQKANGTWSMIKHLLEKI